MAGFVYEVSCGGERGLQDAVGAWSQAICIPAWTALPEVSAVDAYVMATSRTRDPFVAVGVGPLLLAMLHFNTAEQMSQAIAAPAFAQSLDGLPQGVAVTGTPFERRLFPVGGEAAPGPLTAPFSVCGALPPPRGGRSRIRLTLHRRPSAALGKTCPASVQYCAICRSTRWRRLPCRQQTS